MTSENITKERWDQLGLPPMELAESSENSTRDNSGLYKCLLPSLHKLVIMLLLTTFGIGTYVLLLRLSDNSDYARNTEIIILTGNNEIPNVTVHNMEFFLQLKNETADRKLKSEPKLKRKKRHTSTPAVSPTDTEDRLNLNDEQLQKAREIILKHDIICNNEEKQEICKNYVSKLKAIVENDEEGKMKEDLSRIKLKAASNDQQNDVDIKVKPKIAAPTDLTKREALPNSHLDSILESVPNMHLEARDASPHSHSVSPQHLSESCLLARLLKQTYPRAKEIYDPEYPAPHYDHQISPQSRYFSPSLYAPYLQERDVDLQRRPIHPQDADIFMNFLIAAQQKANSTTEEPDRAANSSREIICEPGTIPCLSGDTCVDEKQWCDGNVDCIDVSDEARCTCKSRVDKSRLCDGYFDCPFGEDEMGCYGCSETMFSCEDLDMNSQSTCFTKEQRCNNVIDCPNHKDEVECNMLAPSLLKKPLFAISNTEGFLHRNFKGDWYAVCKNPYMWAHDACKRETGLIVRPPIIQYVPIDPTIKIDYINTGPGGLIQTSDTCMNSSAVYVRCPDLICGTRVQSKSQLLRENAAIENHLYGRNKRFLLKNHPYPLMFYGNRLKRDVEETNTKTNSENKFDRSKRDFFDTIRNKRTESRVVGGKPSQPAAWPWMVAVYRNGMFHCGGVVISHSWVVSAAHCVHKFWDHYYEVQVGMLRRFSFSPQEQSHKVTHVIVNPHYSQTDMKNDLSLLKVEPAIQFSRWVRPICLPSPDSAGSDWLWGPPPGTICTSVGWGSTTEHGPDPDHMREVEVPIWANCKHREDRAGNEICAGLVEGGRDACQGDSGGPLLCRNPLNSQQWYMAGIVSHGDGCARKDEPGVYTRVSLFVKWIRYHISSKILPKFQPLQECPGFKCESGISKCLPNKRKCDKIVDCLNGEDEINCKYTKSVSTLTDSIFVDSKSSLEEIFTKKEVQRKSNSATSDDKKQENTSSSKLNLDDISSTPRSENEKTITTTEIIGTVSDDSDLYNRKNPFDQSHLNKSNDATFKEFLDDVSSTSLSENNKTVTTTEIIDTVDDDDSALYYRKNSFDRSQSKEWNDTIGDDDPLQLYRKNSFDRSQSKEWNDTIGDDDPLQLYRKNSFDRSQSKEWNDTIGDDDPLQLYRKKSFDQSQSKEWNDADNSDLENEEHLSDNPRLKKSNGDEKSDLENEENHNKHLRSKESTDAQKSNFEHKIMNDDNSEKLSISEESATAEPKTVTIKEITSPSRGDAEMITMDFSAESLESGSSVLGHIKETTTQKLSTDPVKNSDSFEDGNKTEKLKISTSDFTHNDFIKPTQNDQLTTPSNLIENHEENLKDKDENESGFLITLLPNSHTTEPDQEATYTKLMNDDKNVTVSHQHKQPSAKKLPDYNNKSGALYEIEDMVLSELEPAKIRRKHRNPDEFECRRIEQTVPYQHRCDRKADCEDGTDELDCTCTDYLLTFDEQLICDGVIDCADGQDETDCFSCPEDYFLCKKSRICLPEKHVCDGKAECPLGEDELNCFTLTNGKEIEFDLDNRPIVNLEGYLTKKHKNYWHVVCDDKLSIEQQEQAATHICRYLGFSSANTYNVKYINLKENEIAARSLDSKRSRRDTVDRVPVHFAHRIESGENDTSRHVIIEEPQLIKEHCVPNITKTCKSLYVYCDSSLFTDFDDSENMLLREAESTDSASNHTWPWIAKVFVEGDYRCTGVLVNLSWVLVSESCLWDSTLTHHYITVVLGSHRTLESMNGMHEQVYQVDTKKDVYRSKASLLHLKEPAHYSNVVKPMVIASSYSLEQKSTCVAVGQDKKNNTISVFLEETSENCHPSNRCFKRISNETICPFNPTSYRLWAGIISCHTELGWYPAASFVDGRGECGLGDHINATDIENLRNEIKHHDAKKRMPSIDEDYGDDCAGVRCGRGRCVPLLQVCDGVRDCEDGKDEAEVACEKKHTMCDKDPYHKGCECSVGQMKCRNGKCISKELFRDGNNDCGDGTDEPGQTICKDYLATVMPSRLCDGVLHCHDRSDEDPMFCKCFAKKNYKCGSIKSGVDHCVAPDTVCDGVRDCPNGEDEQTCMALNAPYGTPYGTGQVIVRSHGVWHSKCYPSPTHTKSELEAICSELGFFSGHAKQINEMKNLVVHPHNNLVVDPFNEIILNNNTIIKMRNTHEPLAKAIFDTGLKECYPVFIECR